MCASIKIVNPSYSSNIFREYFGQLVISQMSSSKHFEIAKWFFYRLDARLTVRGIDG